MTISSRYSNRSIPNPNYYSTINIPSGNTTQNAGIVFLPYIMKCGDPIIDSYFQKYLLKKERIEKLQKLKNNN